MEVLMGEAGDDGALEAEMVAVGCVSRLTVTILSTREFLAGVRIGMLVGWC